MNTATLRNRRAFPPMVLGTAFVSAALVVALLGGGMTQIMYGIGGGILASIPILGVYTYGRKAGMPHSHVVGVTAVTFGLMYILALLARLLLEFPGTFPSKVLGL